MGRATRGVRRLHHGFRIDAPAGRPDAWRNRRGDSPVLVRRGREASELGLCYRSGFCRMPGRARHHARDRDDDISQMADVPCLDWRGHMLRRPSRLRPCAPKSAPRHDRGLGIVGRRRNGDGADVRSLWRRHEAGRRHAISAGRVRWTGGVAGRSGMDGAGRRVCVDRLVPSSGAGPFLRNLGLGRRRGNRRGQIQNSRRRLAGADVYWRAAFRDASSYNHAAALAFGDLLRDGRLGHWPPVHARDGPLCVEATA